MLTISILVPLLAAMVFALWPSMPRALARVAGVAVASVPLVLLIVAWLGFDPTGPRFQCVTEVAWIEGVGAGYRVGVDGIALVVATMAALLFVVALAYPVEDRDRPAAYVGWMLFLEAVSLGVFFALDLLLFYVFFDLSLVGMYFLIGIWGHDGREAAAMKFVLYTFAGSLVMLLGVLGLALSAEPMTFDMRTLMLDEPWVGTAVTGPAVLFALLFGLFVKTPVVPLHTWLPDAHVEAPAPVSAILAGVLLKMGTYGMIRIVYGILPVTFTEAAVGVAALAVLSIVYGAFVAWGQDHLKRRIAYTSITHMGYTVLGIAAAALAAAGQPEAARLALDGATYEMVAHGLITGALFLITGSLWQRRGTFEMGAYGGLAGRAPRMTALAVVAAFGSLGMPGLAGFVAEFQIFTGAITVEPVWAALAVLGVLVTAALFIQLLQKVFFGPASPASAAVRDLSGGETLGLGVLLGLAVVLGIAPGFVLELIAPASQALLGSH